MSELRFSYPACVIAGKDTLTVQDIAILREIALPQGARCEADVVSLLAINNSCRRKCPEWKGYFVETIFAFLMEDIAPHGIVDDAKSGLLQRLFSASGLIRTEEELQLVLTLIDRAPAVPESLTAFALDQLRLALQFNKGAYSERRPQSALGILAADLRFVESILSAAREKDDAIAPLAIAVLGNIDAVAATPLNHPLWRDLMNALRDPSRDGTPSKRRAA